MIAAIPCAAHVAFAASAFIALLPAPNAPFIGHEAEQFMLHVCTA